VILFNGLDPAGVTVWLMMHQQQQLWVLSDKFSIYTSNLELQHAVFSILQDYSA
jgi:hypothetical protein